MSYLHARPVVVAAAAVVVLVGAGVAAKVMADPTPQADVVAAVGASSVGYTTLPNQMLDVSVNVTNQGDDVVTFGTASLLTVDGYRAATLGPVGIYQQPNAPLLSIQWPPLVPSTGGRSAFTTDTYPVQALAGYVLAPKKQVTLVYAMRGDGKFGNFVAGGVRLEYSYKGSRGSSNVWGAGVDCVKTDIKAPCQPGLVDAVLTKIDEIRKY